MAWIGDYSLDKKKPTKIVDLLHKYQYVFTRDYKDLKGLVQEMGQMKIDLIPGSKPINKWPYKLSHKYKPVV
jgi:hypothetical protein